MCAGALAEHRFCERLFFRVFGNAGKRTCHVQPQCCLNALTDAGRLMLMDQNGRTLRVKLYATQGGTPEGQRDNFFRMNRESCRGIWQRLHGQNRKGCLCGLAENAAREFVLAYSTDLEKALRLGKFGQTLSCISACSEGSPPCTRRRNIH